MSLKLLVFDCDGVLVSSKEANEAFYNYLVKKIGREPLSKEEVEFIHMHSVKECLEYLVRDCPHKFKELWEVYQQTPYSMFFDYLVIEDGLYDFLKWAKPRFKIALCTNRSNSTEPLLNHFNLKPYFDFVMDATKVPKSDPRALGEILEFFKVKPEEVLYIGDSEVDLNLAKHFGVKLVAFKNPNLKADFTVNSYKELKKLIEDVFLSHS
ncbi:MAG: HAD family hydrolase [Thermodesulfobacteria bacterium]|nr:HAD family hydrolase [Thermodesulfobacteriota bacterium]